MAQAHAHAIRTEKLYCQLVSWPSGEAGGKEEIGGIDMVGTEGLPLSCRIDSTVADRLAPCCFLESSSLLLIRLYKGTSVCENPKSDWKMIVVPRN